MSNNYNVMLKVKKYYSYDQFIFMCKQALKKGKITQEEYDQLTEES